MEPSPTLRLHEWIAQGRDRGMIRDAQTVVLAYCLDERQAVPWIADIVNGKAAEKEVIPLLRRALQETH